MSIDKDCIRKAVKTLLACHANAEVKKNVLFTDEPYIILELRLSSTDELSDEPKCQTVPLKHRVYRAAAEALLLSRNPQRKYKDMVKEASEGSSLSSIRRVIDVKHFRTKFGEFAKRRELKNAYDLFLADKKIYHELPRILGTKFMFTHKMPHPVNLSTPQTAADSVGAVLSSARLVLRKRTPTPSLIIGHVSQPEDSIEENISAALEFLFSTLSSLPWATGHVKLSNNVGVAMPVFGSTSAAPSATTPAAPKAGGKAESKKRPRSESAEPAKPAAKPAAKPDAKPAAKHDAKPAAKPDAKPAAKPDAKPAAKPDAKQAAKPDAKPAAKPSAQAAPGKSTAAKPEAKKPAGKQPPAKKQKKA